MKKLNLKRRVLWLQHTIRMYRLPISKSLRKNGRNTRKESWLQSKEGAYQMLRRQGRLGQQVEIGDPTLRTALLDE